jgi:tRNA(fMet)-specific endonuclease VapC
VSKANGRLAVDSNAVIAYREGVPEVCRLLDGAKSLFMPVTVLGELLYGAINSQRREANEKAVYAFWAQCVPIFSDEAVARRYADTRAVLRQQGRPIPENDIWIAAACLEADAAVVSHDDHFVGIAGLDVVRWGVRGQT